MVIETRYRDIPWEAILPFHAHMTDDGLDWELMRGRCLRINVPALPDSDGCGGPWFRIEAGPTTASVVCHHLAEIGD